MADYTEANLMAFANLESYREILQARNAVGFGVQWQAVERRPIDLMCVIQSGVALSLATTLQHY